MLLKLKKHALKTKKLKQCAFELVDNLITFCAQKAICCK